MSRIDASELSFEGTWIDGYIPKLKEMKKLAQLYRSLDASGDYGFSAASDAWLAEDFFSGIASAIREKFHHETSFHAVEPIPCLMWLIKTNKKPSEPKMLPLYEEYETDVRKENYYHLITVHRQCPVEEECLQRVIKDLHFESKLETAYSDPKRFTVTAQTALDYYVNIMAAPWQQIKNHLYTLSEKQNINLIAP
jgi:hypothetical protein